MYTSVGCQPPAVFVQERLPLAAHSWRIGRTSRARAATARALPAATATAMSIVRTAVATRTAHKIFGVMKVGSIPRPSSSACLDLCFQCREALCGPAYGEEHSPPGAMTERRDERQGENQNPDLMPLRRQPCDPLSAPSLRRLRACNTSGCNSTVRWWQDLTTLQQVCDLRRVEQLERREPDGVRVPSPRRRCLSRPDPAA